MNLRHARFLLMFLLCELVRAASAGDVGASGNDSLLVIDLGDGVRMKFVLVPSGSFNMGSSTSTLLDQRPVHPVTIRRAFYLGQYEVTQDQWQAVMGETPSIYKGPNYPDSAKYPVENVSWIYCQSFLDRLKQKVSGYEFRLPTEEEWEYACRAGSSKEFSFGETEVGLGEYGWYSSNAGGHTHPVGLKKPNAWALYDMHGNVWEWCSDIYQPYPGGKLASGTGSGTSRVLRGGAFNSLPARLTCCYRHDLEPDDCARYYGLRCVAVKRTTSR